MKLYDGETGTTNTGETTMTMHKTAKATRTGGDTYTVTYVGANDMDSDVPYAYLQRLARDGYTVTVDQRGHRPEGEPESFVVDAD